ncbi:hypothetical protein ANN_04644 [Periplaneta americana]|uniref:Uncharacterized protein n=1 Tax=Periplaneta americana TaxID=6978 RepID=A0ABQ8TAI7_PERAM|nr:hypothetical protein ANN_04644 [Periplaneta americana]
MTGLCEGDNEPPGSLKAICNLQKINPNCLFDLSLFSEPLRALPSFLRAWDHVTLNRDRLQESHRQLNCGERSQTSSELFWEEYIITLSNAKYSYVKIIGACKKRGFVISKKSTLRVPNKTGKARIGLIPEWKKQANPPPVTSLRTLRHDTN